MPSASAARPWGTTLKVPEFAYAGEPVPELTEEEHQHRAKQTRQRRTTLRPDVLAGSDFSLYLWRTAPALTFAVTPDGAASLNGSRAESVHLPGEDQSVRGR
jgi:hypothetical protein